MKTKLFVLIVLVLAPLAALRAADAPSPKPNILFLLSDDHSYPYLGCYGNKDVHTPNLDRLASQGMRFDRMFVGCPQCVPSRASLMTGRSPVAVRMVRFTSPLPADLPALPDLLRDGARYFTGVAGRSYHLDGPPTTGQRGAPTIGGTLDRYELRRFRDRLDYVEEVGAMRDFGGKLAPEFVRAYFTIPRSTYELYDLEADPGEITNLAGNKKYAQVERELKQALTEKMVLDWDFLPTPLR